MATTLEKETQKALNELFNAGLKDDGVIGAITLSKFPDAIKSLKGIYKRKNYKWDSAYNFGAFRMDDVLTNKFTDWGFIIINDIDIRFFPMSTKPGLIYMQQKDTKGGIVKEGQYINMYSLENSGFSGLPFLRQTKAYDFYRDYDLDNVIDRGKVYNDATYLSGFHVHSYYNTKTKWFWELPVVSHLRSGILSKGCQVTVASIWKLVLPYLELMVKTSPYHRITYTLLHKEDLKLL